MPTGNPAGSYVQVQNGHDVRDDLGEDREELVSEERGERFWTGFPGFHFRNGVGLESQRVQLILASSPAA